jgi:esterase/lipase superfamily enzyme
VLRGIFPGVFRQHDLIPSRAMERRMHLWRFGHFGVPVLVFPSASGMAHEWEAHGMIEALGELIDGGKLKLYCTESNVAEAWTRRDRDPAWRIRRHQAYETYVVDELAAYIRADCRTAGIPIAVTGTSLGAYYAANFALKHSPTFRWALCMSGRYDVSWLTNGFQSSDVFYNNPMAYVPGLEGEALERVRRYVHLVLVCGRGKWEEGNIEETHAFANLLEVKGISHQRDVWGLDVAHEWPWWRRQARYHLGRAFGR